MSLKGWLLALDFDGVIWDSVGECYVTATRAWSTLFGPLKGEYEKAFRDARWMARTGHDFYVLLRMIQAEPGRSFLEYPKHDFLRLREEWWDEASRYEQVFCDTRDQARDADPAAWMALQRPYPGMVEEMPRLQEAFAGVVIATTKDEASARLLLESRGLHLPILGKEFSRDKADQIRHLAKNASLPCERVVFIDDLVENLEPVAATGASTALAKWGYNVPAEHEEARRKGYPVLDEGRVLEDVARWLQHA